MVSQQDGLSTGWSLNMVVLHRRSHCTYVGLHLPGQSWWKRLVEKRGHPVFPPCGSPSVVCSGCLHLMSPHSPRRHCQQTYETGPGTSHHVYIRTCKIQRSANCFGSQMSPLAIFFHVLAILNRSYGTYGATF